MATPKQQVQSSSRDDDAVDFEYKYYCLLLRELQPNLPEDQEQRERIMQWIHLLVDPLTSAQNVELRVIRNRYLFMICMALIGGNAQEFISITSNYHIRENKKKKPKKAVASATPEEENAIADENGTPLSMIKALDPVLFKQEAFKEACCPQWEKEDNWGRRLKTIKDAENIKNKNPKLRNNKKEEKLCSVHTSECPRTPLSMKLGKCLDSQFRYLLSLAESYKNHPNILERASLWLQALVKIDKDACPLMKGIRNDYIMLMVGYMCMHEMKGPFEDSPTELLPPLNEAIGYYISKQKSDKKDKKDKKDKPKVPLNPCSDSVEAFMNEVPNISEGAFAFISLSGLFE